MLTPKKLALAHTLGPVVVDIAGTVLTENEIRRLEHPMTGAVILFTRNFTSVEMLRALCGAIHAVRPGILITVDHEGGRVQRFREGFTEVPSMAACRAAGDQAQARLAAAGYVLASELRAAGVDMTFAPVLDIDYGRSAVIGNRSLGSERHEVECNARALMSGLRLAGMANCGKHFPGHGWAEADSHVACPTDNRSAAEIRRDLSIYRGLALELESIMTAHVAYQCFDGEVATYSPRLLKTILREELGFSGLIFSDDLSMKGACGDEPPLVRAQKALAAGCDMVLHCNHPEEADEILAGLEWGRTPAFDERLARLLPDEAESVLSMEALRAEPRWQRAEQLLADIEGFRAA